MTPAQLIGLGQMPIVWTVIAEVFFLVYLTADKGITYNPAEILRRFWPILRVLGMVVLGALPAILLMRFIGPLFGALALFVFTLPAAAEADRVLKQMRPDDQMWRWVATGFTLLMTAATLSLASPN